MDDDVRPSPFSSTDLGSLLAHPIPKYLGPWSITPIIRLPHHRRHNTIPPPHFRDPIENNLFYSLPLAIFHFDIDFSGSISPFPTRPQTFKQPKYLKRILTNDEVSNGHECVICLKKLSRNVEYPRLRCGHLFHQVCLNAWLGQNQTCPHCRENAAWDYNNKQPYLMTFNQILLKKCIIILQILHFKVAWNLRSAQWHIMRHHKGLSHLLLPQQSSYRYLCSSTHRERTRSTIWATIRWAAQQSRSLQRVLGASPKRYNAVRLYFISNARDGPQLFQQRFSTMVTFLNK
jgi:hypothetical protein